MRVIVSSLISPDTLLNGKATVSGVIHDVDPKVRIASTALFLSV